VGVEGLTLNVMENHRTAHLDRTQSSGGLCAACSTWHESARAMVQNQHWLVTPNSASSALPSEARGCDNVFLPDAQCQHRAIS
jgi:hypothetical protein